MDSLHYIDPRELASAEAGDKEREMEESDEDYDGRLTEVKLKINALLYEQLPGDTTIRRMETIACGIFDLIRDEWESRR